MRNTTTFPRLALLAAGLGVCLTLGLVANVVAQDDARGTRKTQVGVVDIGVLFKNYKRKDDLENGINDSRKQMLEQIAAQAPKRGWNAKLLKGTFEGAAAAMGLPVTKVVTGAISTCESLTTPGGAE